MNRARCLGLAGAAGVGLLILACEQSAPHAMPTSPATPLPRVPTPAPSPPSKEFAQLGGVYRLTVEFPPACAGIRELRSPRRYQVRLEAAARFHGIYISGGGYPDETVGGNLYYTNSGATLSWNNFDPYCDGDPEPLSGGRTLMVCGDGPATYDETSIAAEVAGSVFITADGPREMACRGTVRLAFARVGP